jgi:single-stranded DNA-binding protein
MATIDTFGLAPHVKNHVEIDVRITQPPIFKTTKTNKRPRAIANVVHLTCSNGSGKKGVPFAQFIPCTAYDDVAIEVSKLVEGDEITIEGQIYLAAWKVGGTGPTKYQAGIIIKKMSIRSGPSADRPMHEGSPSEGDEGLPPPLESPATQEE